MAERLAEFNAVLARLRRNDPTLVELSLVSYGLVPETIEPIAEALKTNKALKVLNLSRNRIRDQGATALSFALRINDTLESLDISWNEIGAPGAVSVADTLLVNHTLLDLTIEGNIIQVEGGNRLAENLKNNRTLQSLNISACGLTGDQWKVCLKQNSTLLRLEAMDGNDNLFITNGVIDKLIRTNSILNSLALSGDINMIMARIYAEYPTLMTSACSQGHVAAVKRLLDWGVDPNLNDSNSGFSPLQIAVRIEDIELVRLLLACGAISNDSLASTTTNKDIIGVLKKMKNNILDLSDGALRSVAIESISEDNISGLNLANNLLGKIPPKLLSKLLNMKELTTLSLADNNMATVPDEIGNLVQLTNLNLAGNRLDGLPSSMGNLVNLKELNLKYNPLTTIPEEIVKKGTARLLQYLKEMQAPTKPWNRIKLIVVGQENVGKTHLVRRLQKKEYPKNISTDGIEVQSWATSKKVEFRVYDFGGQEVFYPTHTFFLSDRALYVVVFNLVDDASRSRIEYWLKIVRSTGIIPCPIVLVGTHLDDPQCTPSHVQDMQDRVKRFKMTFTNIKDVIFVSCTSGLGIKELRQRLTELASNQKIMTTLVPQTYLVLDRIVLHQKEAGRPILKWNEYQQLGSKANITDDRTLISATEFLHDVGSLIWFNQSSLRDLVILDPQWLSNVMASIISFKSNWKNGVLHHPNLPIIWKNYPESLHKVLLGILEKFEVVFPIKGQEGASVVPTMLPDDPTERYNELSNRVVNEKLFERIERTYKFDFLPLGFFARLIVRIYHTTELFCHDPFQKGLLITPSRTFTRLETMTDEEAAKYSDDMLIKSALSHGYEQAAIRFHSQSHMSILNITIWRPIDLQNVNNGEGSLGGPGMADNKRDNLIIPIVDTIESLIQSSFKKYEENIRRFVVYSQKSSAMDFNYDQLVQQILAGKSSIEMNSLSIPIAKLAPDVAFVHVPIITEVETSKKLGEGGFGIVYKGKWDGRQVAVKELKVKANSEVSKFREFQREVYTMSALSHPCLVQLYGVQLSPLRMIMEYVPGTDLAKILRDPTISDAQFTWRIRMKLALDIARAMRYLQSMRPPIIHRDLRSPNIFVTSLDENVDVMAKVADFGLASKVLTSLNEVLFTWQWLAPEVIDSDSGQYDERADTYSYGIVLWEIATRQYPFAEFEQYITKTVENLSAAQLADAAFLQQLKDGGWEIHGTQAIREEYQKQRFIDLITKENLRPTIPLNTPPQFRRLIESCWHREPSARPSFDDIVSVLSEMLGQRQRTWTRFSGPKAAIKSTLEAEMAAANAAAVAAQANDESTARARMDYLMDIAPNSATPLPVTNPMPLRTQIEGIAYTSPVAPAPAPAPATSSRATLPTSMMHMRTTIEGWSYSGSNSSSPSSTPPMQPRGPITTTEGATAQISDAAGTSSGVSYRPPALRTSTRLVPPTTELTQASSSATTGATAPAVLPANAQLVPVPANMIPMNLIPVNGPFQYPVNFMMPTAVTAPTTPNTTATAAATNQQQQQTAITPADSITAQQHFALSSSTPAAVETPSRSAPSATVSSSPSLSMEPHSISAPSTPSMIPKRATIGGTGGGTNLSSSPDWRRSIGLKGNSSISAKSKPIILSRKLEPDISKPALILTQVQNQVWIGQQDGSISVFANTSPPRFLTTFSANKKEVYAIATVGNHVWSGSSDGTISIWDVKKFKLKKSLKGHMAVVKSILTIPSADKSKPTILTGDVAGNVLVWNGSQMVTRFTVENGQPINCIYYVSTTRHVWIGSFKKIYVYSADDWTRVTIFPEAHGGIINSMVSTETTLWSCCSDMKTVCSWDAYKLVQLQLFKDTPRLYCLAIVHNPALQMRHLWAGALDNMIYVYNTNSSELELVETLKGHTDMVYGILKVDGDDVVWSGSRDCSVRTWSF